MTPNQPPFPPPGPLQPLQYAHLVQRRPGLITAIGVMSIVVASLSLIANLLGGMMSIGFTAASRSMASAQAAASVTTIVRNAGPNGLSETQRQVVQEALSLKTPLSSGQSNQLDAILADHGKTLLPSLGPDATADDVAELIREHRTINNQGPDGATGDRFILPDGSLDLYDQQAVFTPANAADPITVAAPSIGVGPFAGPSGSPQPTTAPTTLPAADVQSVIARAQTLANGKLNPAQLQTLRSTLESPTQALVDRSRSPRPASAQLTNVMVDNTGQAHVLFQNGSLVIAPQGQITSQVNWGFQSPASVTRAFASIATPIVIVAIEALLSLGLAIYLLIAGILTLRQSPRGRFLHTLYIIAKIPLVILAATGLTWLMTRFYSSLFSSTSGPMSATESTTIALVQAGIIVLPGLIYPLALIFVLRSRTVREYYSPTHIGA